MTAVVRASSSEDLNPRPAKRLRHDSSDCPSQNATSFLNTPENVTPTSTPPSLRRLPPAALLLAIPALVMHPKDHKMHLKSLALARHALKRCLTLPSLEPVEECRAWTGLAELGMMWLDTGADGLNIDEVETALAKALSISQKHPALRLYTPHLTILSTRLAQQYQANSKYAAHTLRRMIKTLESTAPVTSTSTSTPSHVFFTLHLELVHSLSLALEDEASSTPMTASGPPSLGKCLAALNDMVRAAEARLNGESNLVTLLCAVIKLQLLVRHGVWSAVPEALEEAENVFKEYDALLSPSIPSADTSHCPPELASQRLNTTTTPNDYPPVPPSLRTHLLILSVLFHTYAGAAQAATERLRLLHALLDTGVLEPKADKANTKIVGEGALDGWADGILEIPLQGSAIPLRIRTTPPRVLHALAFLLSAVSKRDAVGRAPKKGVFARAGLDLRELMGPFGGREGTRLARIKADLIGEVVAISIQRSDFPAAQRALDDLISHTRSESLFELYQARIALFHGQMAHARGDTDRARKCYEVAAYVSGVGLGGAIKGDSSTKGRKGSHPGKTGSVTDEWVGWAARAGVVWVRLGVLRRAEAVRGSGSGGKSKERDRQTQVERDREIELLRREGKILKQECEGRGATLNAVGELLNACLAEEFLGAKQHLHRALTLATTAQDNHLRALVLALSASHYLHTARDHAITMLGTCAQLAVGLGALPKGDKGKQEKTGEKMPWSGGNAPLGLWVGERLAELRRLGGETQEAQNQERMNLRLREAVHEMGIEM